MSLPTLFGCLYIIIFVSASDCSPIHTTSAQFKNDTIIDAIRQSRDEEQLISIMKSPCFPLLSITNNTDESQYYLTLEQLYLGIIQQLERFGHISKLRFIVEIIHQQTSSLPRNVLSLEFWNRVFIIYFSPKHNNILDDYEYIVFIKRMLVLPGFETFNIIIDGLCHHPQIKQADEVISLLIQYLIQKRKLIPSLYFANLWMKLFRNRHLVESAKSLWRCYKVPQKTNSHKISSQNLLTDRSWTAYNSLVQFLSLISNYPTNQNWPFFWETATSFPNQFQYLSTGYFREYAKICIRAISKFGKLSVIPSFFEIWRPYLPHFRKRHVLKETQKLYVMAQLVRKHIFNETEGFDPWISVHNQTHYKTTLDAIVHVLSQRDLVLDNRSFTVLMSDLVNSVHKRGYPRRCTLLTLKKLERRSSKWYDNFLRNLSVIAENPRNYSWCHFRRIETSYIKFEDYDIYKDDPEYLTAGFFRICKRAMFNYGKLRTVQHFFEIWKPYFQRIRDQQILAEAQKLYVIMLLVRRQSLVNLEEDNLLNLDEFEEFKSWRSVINHTKIGNEPAIETVITKISQNDVIIDNTSLAVLFSDLMDTDSSHPYPRRNTLQILGAVPLIKVLQNRISPDQSNRSVHCERQHFFSVPKRIHLLLEYLEKTSSLESFSNFIEWMVYEDSISVDWELITAALTSYLAANGPNVKYFKMYFSIFRAHNDRTYLIPKFVSVHQETLLNPECQESFALSQTFLRLGFVYKQFHSQDYGENADEYPSMIRELTVQLLRGCCSGVSNLSFSEARGLKQLVYQPCQLLMDPERAKDQLGLEILYSIYTNDNTVNMHRVLFPMESDRITERLHFDFRKFDGISDRLQIWWIIGNRLEHAWLSEDIKHSTVIILCNEAVHTFITDHLLKGITHGVTVDQQGIFRITCIGADLCTPSRPLITSRVSSEVAIWLMMNI